MIERGTVGGTCVNVGCIPSKALLAAAANRHRADGARFPGASTRLISSSPTPAGLAVSRLPAGTFSVTLGEGGAMAVVDATALPVRLLGNANRATGGGDIVHELLGDGHARLTRRSSVGLGRFLEVSPPGCRDLGSPGGAASGGFTKPRPRSAAEEIR